MIAATRADALADALADDISTADDDRADSATTADDDSTADDDRADPATTADDRRADSTADDRRRPYRLPCLTAVEVLGVRVCMPVKCWAEGYPESTMRNYEVAALESRIMTVPQLKQATMPPGSIRVDSNHLRAHVQTFIRDDVTNLSELQPNVRPFENVSGDVVLVRHLDPIMASCRRCKRATTTKQGDKEGAVTGTSVLVGLCEGICRYSAYAQQSISLGEAYGKTSLFQTVFNEVLIELKISMRRHKGVSSDCETCRIHGHVLALPTEERTDAQYEHAEISLVRHRQVVDRFKNEERSMQAQSRRDIRLRNRDGVVHSMKDKAASENTSCPFTPDNGPHGQRGKNANAVQLPISFMMIAMYGAGVAIPLGLPWLKTKANFNLTCSWIGLELFSQKYGYVPQNISEHVDRGDQNITLIAIGYHGALISSGIVQTAMLSSGFVGHNHGGADGENQHYISEINGDRNSNRPGVNVRTIPEMLSVVPRAYNKTDSARCLGAPLLAATLDWDAYLKPTLEDIGGVTSSLRKDNIQKNAEPHLVYLFRNKHGRVAFQYKTKHDVILDKEWQGGDDGIPLFKAGHEPDLRKTRPTTTGFDCNYMTATSESSKVKRSGRGLTIAKDLKAHLTAEGTYSDKVRRTWDEWFEHAWPTTAAEFAVFVDSAKDGSNALSSYFTVPDADPSRLKDDPSLSKPRDLSGRPMVAEEIAPIQLLTYPASEGQEGWTEKQRRAAVREQIRLEDGDMYAIQPKTVPPRMPGMHVLVWNLFTHKRELLGQWVSAVVVRMPHKSEKRPGAYEHAPRSARSARI